MEARSSPSSRGDSLRAEADLFATVSPKLRLTGAPDLALRRRMVHCSIMPVTATITPGAPRRPSRHATAAANPRPDGVKLGSVFATEFGDVASAGMRLAWRRYANALRGLVTLMHCRTPQDFVAARAALLCEDLELVRGGYERTGDIVAEAAGDAVRAITPQA